MPSQQENSSAASWNAVDWLDDWVDQKNGNGEKQEIETPLKLLKNLEVWKALGIIALIGLAIGAMNFGGYGWIGTLTITLEIVFIGGCIGIHIYMKNKKITPRRNEQEGERDVYRLLQRVGAMTNKNNSFDDWYVWNNTQEAGADVEQAVFRIDCTAIGVDLMKYKDKINLEISKFFYYGNKPAYGAYIQPAGGSAYTLIVDLRDPFAESSEIINWFGDKPELKEYYGLKKNSEGYPDGNIAVGAIDKGIRYGKIKNTFLYQHHYGISGMSGYGKSNAIHFLLWQIAEFDNVQIVYIDPNETDGELWRDRCVCVANKAQSQRVFDEIQKIAEERAQILKNSGKAKWMATKKYPQIVVVIDEVKFLLSGDKKKMEDLENLEATVRKYGITLILGTQYPKKGYIGGTWENLHYKISAKLPSTTETETVFGSNASLAPCHDIEQRGVFYIQDDAGKIERVHVPYVSEEIIKETAEMFKPFRDTFGSSLKARFDKIVGTNTKGNYNANSGNNSSSSFSDNVFKF